MRHPPRASLIAALSFALASSMQAYALPTQDEQVLELRRDVPYEDRDANQRYKVWREERDLSKKFALACALVRELPSSKAADAVFYYYFFASDSLEIQRLSIARSLIDALDEGDRGYSIHPVDSEHRASAPPFYPNREYALAYLATHSPEQRDRDLNESRYCRDYSCSKGSILNRFKASVARPPN